MNVFSAAKTLTCSRINENNEVCLNIKHFYYTQDQLGQMGIKNDILFYALKMTFTLR